MDEIAPGVLHWTAVHPKIKVEVSSYFLTDSSTAIDPLVPDDDVSQLGGLRPERIILTNRHHLRSAEAISREFDCPILCHEAGLHEFENGGPDVQGFRWGDEVAPGVTALEVGTLCDEEAALLIGAGDGFLSVADAVMRYGGEELHFVPDQYLVEPGEDLDAMKRAIREAYGRLLDQPFDSLLVAHGDPLVGGGKEALRRFVEQGPQ